MSNVDEDAFQSADLEPLDDIDSDFFADDFDDLSNDLISQNYYRTNNNEHNSDSSSNYRNLLNDWNNMSGNNDQSSSNAGDSSTNDTPTTSTTNANSENNTLNAGNNASNNNSNNSNSFNDNIINNNNRNNNHVPILGVRDRLFHALFFRGCLIYARLVPPPIRRIIEFVILLKAVVAFFILIYVHTTFIHKPTTCLSHIQDSWPRDGILRVEILRNGTPDYSVENSYAREKKIREQRAYEMNMFLTTFKLPFEWFGDIHIESSLDDNASNQDSRKKKPMEDEYPESESTEQRSNVSTQPWTDSNTSLFNGSWTNVQILEGFGEDELKNDEVVDEETSFNETMMKHMTSPFRATDQEIPVLEELTDIEKLMRAVWPDEEYIVEFSLEYGFLRLSPQVRQKLNIPVKIVTLNPSEDICFGDQIMRFILEHVIGYDDLLMISIKTLAEKENDKGFLRNVVTGEHYRFVTLWMSRVSYIIAFGIMLAFTLSISMLLRYSHHQIFVFIVNLLQMAEFNTEVTFLAAPLFTVILALIGIEAMMSEFFNDSSTAFYIILIVWIADQYESVCCQRAVTKRHWIKFFYLYHFSFYAYHYRFNGQFSGLALVTSWLFIEHSMIYFLHHYELPMMLQRYQLQQFVLRQRTTNSNSDSVTFLSTSGDIGINNNNNNYNVGTEQFRLVAINGELASGIQHANNQRSRFWITSILQRYRTAAITAGLIIRDRRLARTVDAGGDRETVGGPSQEALLQPNISSGGDTITNGVQRQRQSESAESSQEEVPSKSEIIAPTSSQYASESSRTKVDDDTESSRVL